jgi:DNA-binding IclR family transcriptional regulator
MESRMSMDADLDSPPSDRRRGIQSVEIGFRVLSAIADAGGAVSLSQLGQRTGLSPSQTHRYLQSLIAAGMANQDPATGHYDLGPASRRIGVRALERFDGYDVASRVILDLVAEIRWTALLSVVGPHGPTVVRWFMGRPPVITNLGIGSTLPLFHSATGRAMIAFSHEAELEELLRVAREEAHDMDGVDADEIRRKGRETMVVRMEGRFIPGLRALSAPIFDMQGQLIFVATAIANAAFPHQEDEAIGVALMEACKRVTEESGGRWMA